MSLDRRLGKLPYRQLSHAFNAVKRSYSVRQRVAQAQDYQDRAASGIIINNQAPSLYPEQVGINKTVFGSLLLSRPPDRTNVGP